MKKTVLITGCSSGFGQDGAKYFLERGWKVIATMRTPDAALLPKSDDLRILPLDVTDAGSIKALVAEAGPVDALVNNAGLGGFNAAEAMPMEQIQKIFATNTIGLIALIQAMLPGMRAKKSGVIVNVTSSVTLKALDFLAVYTASKAAVNAFSEVLALELAPHNIAVRVVLPGQAPETKFAANAGAGKQMNFPEPYLAQIQSKFAELRQGTGPKTKSEDVAEAIFRAVTDPAAPSRIPAGADAVALFVR